MLLRLPFLHARQERLRLFRFTSWLQSVRQHAAVFQRVSEGQLRRVADAVRESLAAQEDHGARAIEWQDEILATSFALSVESLRRVHGVVLYDVQIRAARALAQGRIAEMQTGEGKTLTALPAAVAHGLTGQGVHVITTNSYLARRDFEHLRDAYELLGVSVGLLPEQGNLGEKHKAYQCDVTYGTGYDFGFDYLRDQLELRQQTRQLPGESILTQLRGAPVATPTVAQRSRAFAIVDEIDNVLIDDASSPLILSGPASDDAPDAEAYRAARQLALSLEPDKHYHRNASDDLSLTPLGHSRVYDPTVIIPSRLLRRSWTEYVEQALRAEYQFRCGIHYVVQEGTAWVVDTSTGRIFPDRSWRDGLHQAIEAKEGLRITAEKSILAQITRQRFFRLYQRLSGMTGTATGCEREFQSVYGLEIETIPLRVPSRRKILPLRAFATQSAKWEAIVSDIAQIHATGRPILIGSRTIEESEQLGHLLQSRGLACRVLNGMQDADEAEIVSLAGHRGAITVSTNMAGRGTDIRLTDEVEELGGLHVIVTEPQSSARVDRQMIGRCARQGDPGSAQTYVSAEDALIQKHGPWLAQPLRRYANASGELDTDLTAHIARIQRNAERVSYAGRAALLRSDMARDHLIAQSQSKN